MFRGNSGNILSSAFLRAGRLVGSTGSFFLSRISAPLPERVTASRQQDHKLIRF